MLAQLSRESVFLFVGHGNGTRQLLLRPEQLQLGAPEQAGGSWGPLRSVLLLMGCSTAKLFRPIDSSLGGAAGGRAGPRAASGDEFEAFGMPMDVLIGGAPAVLGAQWDVLGGDLDVLTRELLESWCGPAGSAMASPTSLLQSLLVAREACRLPFLTGAAIVCYGVPL